MSWLLLKIRSASVSNAAKTSSNSMLRHFVRMGVCTKVSFHIDFNGTCLNPAGVAPQHPDPLPEPTGLGF